MSSARHISPSPWNDYQNGSRATTARSRCSRVGAWAGATTPCTARRRAVADRRAEEQARARRRRFGRSRAALRGLFLRKVAAARAASFVHAVGSFAWNARLMRRHWGVLRDAAQRRPVVRLLGRALPLLAYDASNDLPGAREALCCSLGYFVQELAHVLGNEPDPVFVAHHVAYITATLPIVCSPRGWAMVSLATLLAEVTNPLQLSWELARAFGCEQVYDALSPPFTCGFAVCRGVLMPLAMGDIAVSIFGRDGAPAPPAMRFAYGVFFVGIGASGVWLAQLVRGFQARRRKKRAQSRRSLRATGGRARCIWCHLKSEANRSAA